MHGFKLAYDPRFGFTQEILLAPSLGELVIEDHYRSLVRDNHKDKYRTVPCHCEHKSTH